MRGSSVFSFISCHLSVLPKKTLLRTVTLSSAQEFFHLLLAKESLQYKLLGMKSSAFFYFAHGSVNNRSRKHLTPSCRNKMEV